MIINYNKIINKFSKLFSFSLLSNWINHFFWFFRKAHVSYSLWGRVNHTLFSSSFFCGLFIFIHFLTLFRSLVKIFLLFSLSLSLYFSLYWRLWLVSEHHQLVLFQFLSFLILRLLLFYFAFRFFLPMLLLSFLSWGVCCYSFCFWLWRLSRLTLPAFWRTQRRIGFVCVCLFVCVSECFALKQW